MTLIIHSEPVVCCIIVCCADTVMMALFPSTSIAYLNIKHLSQIHKVIMCSVVLMHCMFLIIMCLFRLREGVRKMEEKHFSEHNDEHVEFLPVEWRSKLTLDGGLCVFLRVCMRVCTVHVYCSLFGLCFCEQCTLSCSLVSAISQ